MMRQENVKRKSNEPEDLACERCGRYGVVEIGEHFLCVDCYESSGSCCPEFGGDDIWDLEESKHPRM